MTKFYQITDWGDIGSIEEIDTEYERDEDMFYTFEAAKAELLAYFDLKIDRYQIARERIEGLTAEDVEKAHKTISQFVPKGPLLPAEEDFTLKDMERITDFGTPDDPENYVSPGSKGP